MKECPISTGCENGSSQGQGAARGVPGGCQGGQESQGVARGPNSNQGVSEEQAARLNGAKGNRSLDAGWMLTTRTKAITMTRTSWIGFPIKIR